MKLVDSDISDLKSKIDTCQILDALFQAEKDIHNSQTVLSK